VTRRAAAPYVQIGVLSLLVAVILLSTSDMRTPGVFVAFKISYFFGGIDMILGFALMLAVDSVLCFAIIVGGHFLWRRLRGTAGKS
jgi:hypothetical protein